jgi:hypothetical protein
MLDNYYYNALDSLLAMNSDNAITCKYQLVHKHLIEWTSYWMNGFKTFSSSNRKKVLIFAKLKLAKINCLQQNTSKIVHVIKEDDFAVAWLCPSAISTLKRPGIRSGHRTAHCAVGPGKIMCSQILIISGTGIIQLSNWVWRYVTFRNIFV